MSKLKQRRLQTMRLNPFIGLSGVIIYFLLCTHAYGVSSRNNSTPQASSSWRSTRNMDSFPVQGHVAKQVWFWESVFSEYRGNQQIIHDANHPDIIVDIIDFSKLKLKNRTASNLNRAERELVTQKYVERYQLAVQRFANLGVQKALTYGAMEERLHKVYSRSQPALQYLLRGQPKLRGQSGLVDEFSRAAERASPHLAYMEDIFRSHNLPSDLTRITFVESMFNYQAISKVGATGIWQFMPQTARNFMYVNHYIDERNSPYKATRAAAQFLKQNFQELKTWPLAITAYNHGRGGMAKAVKQTGSQDLSQIILKYRSPSFGFASKNFYAEYIAARNTYNKMFAKQRLAQNNLNLQAIPIGKNISVTQILQQTPLDRETLKKHNPCLLPSAFQSYSSTPLPANYELVVPKHMAGSIRTALQKINHSSSRRNYR